MSKYEKKMQIKKVEFKTYYKVGTLPLILCTYIRGYLIILINKSVFKIISWHRPIK